MPEKARLRTMGLALLFFAINMISLGLVSALSGLISDLLTPQYVDLALRYVLVATIMVNLCCVLHYYLAGRGIREDLAKAPA